jgi:hypothetical protein
MFENINEPAVVVASLLAVAIGSIWYSPLVFGAAWMRANGLHTEDDAKKRAAVIQVIEGICAQIVFFFVIAALVPLTTKGFIAMSTLGTLLVLLIASHMLALAILEKKPLSYILINIGYTAISVFGGLAVITYWPW